MVQSEASCPNWARCNSLGALEALEKVAYSNVPQCALSAKGCVACGKQAYLDKCQLLFARQQAQCIESEEDSSDKSRAARVASAKASEGQSNPHEKIPEQLSPAIFAGKGGYTLIQGDLDDLKKHVYLNDNVAELLLQRLRAAYPELLGLETVTYLGNILTAKYASWYGDKLHRRQLVVHLHHEPDDKHYTLSCAYDGQLYWFDTTNNEMGAVTSLALKQLYASSLEPQLQVIRVKMVQQSRSECLLAAIVGAIMLADGSTPMDVAYHKRAQLSDQYAFVQPCIEGTKRIQDWPCAPGLPHQKKDAKARTRAEFTVPAKREGRVWGHGVQRQWGRTIGWKNKAKS